MIRRLVAEGLGTCMLLAAVVGSGIMAQTLYPAEMPGRDGAALLANAIATGAALYVLITLFAPISGAQFNPVFTLVMVLAGRMPMVEALSYALVQCGGAILGVWVAHAMFGQPILQASDHARDGGAAMLSEGVATFGLILVILAADHHKNRQVAILVAGWITSAYWFTASTSFANPAATLARSLTDSFAGIAPASVPAFWLAQGLGAGAALLFSNWLFRSVPPT